MRTLTIKFNPFGWPYLLIGILIMFSCSVLLTYGLIVSYLHGNPTVSLTMVILWPLSLWITVLGLSYAMTKALIGKIQITEKEVIFFNPLMKPVSYSWDKIVSCGLDIMNFNLRGQKMFYLSREYIPPLDYRPGNYYKGVHVFWRKFVRANGAYWSLNKERNLYLLFAVNEKELNALKTLIPERLLERFDDSERRLESALKG